MSHKYPLADVLRVRKFREDAAASELTRRRQAVETARQQVAEKKQALEDYIQWRVRREAELYQEIIRQEVQVKTLDDLKLKVQELRDSEALHVQRVHEAEQALEKAEEAAEEAHLRYQEASKNVQKIDEHKESWAQEMAKIDEADEEKELEDFHVRARDGDEANREGDDV